MQKHPQNRNCIGDTDFVIQGLGVLNEETETQELEDTRMLNYLKRTYNSVLNNRSAFMQLQNPAEILQMFKYLIDAWNSPQRSSALIILSEKEKELISEGRLKYGNSDISAADMIEAVGFFSALKNIYTPGLSGEDESDYWQPVTGEEAENAELSGTDEDDYHFFENQQVGNYELSGWFKKIKNKVKKKAKFIGGKVKTWGKDKGQTIKKKTKIIGSNVKTWRKDKSKNIKKWVKKKGIKIKKVTKKAVKAFMKYNPVTVVTRNAFRGLIELNFRGLASKLERNQKASWKTIKLYIKLGGTKNKMQSSIRKGASRKPLMSRKYDAELQAQKRKQGLGEPLTVTAMIAAATAPILAVMKWLKESGASKLIKKGKDSLKDFLPNKQDNKQSFPNTLPPVQTGDDNQKEEDKDKKKKIIKWTVGGLAATAALGAGYYFFSKDTTHKESKETLTGIVFT